MICVNENNLIPGKREYMNFCFFVLLFIFTIIKLFKYVQYKIEQKNRVFFYYVV